MNTRIGSERHEPSRQVLSELPLRVVVFLRAVASNTAIHQGLALGGYTAQQHAEGLQLLNTVCALEDGVQSAADDLAARNAGAEIAAWIGTHLLRLHIALERLHPEQQQLLDGLDAPNPGAAVLALATLLQRLQQLEGQAAGDPFNTSASAALETLAQRGLNLVERNRLAALVTRAQVSAAPSKVSDQVLLQEQALLRLHQWFADWAATARVFVKRRDLLIALGLAARRSRFGPSRELVGG